MLKKLFIILILTVSFTLTRPVHAANITITCAADGPCDMMPTPNEHLFYELNILPGYNVTRTLTVTNRSTVDDCPLYINTKNENDPDHLAGKLWTNIRDGWTDIYGMHYGSGRATDDKKLTDVFSVGDIFLGTILKASTKIFIWTVTFDPNTGNDYQNKKTVFDFDATISCGVPPTLTPTTTPTNTPTPTPENKTSVDNRDDKKDNNSGGNGGTPTAPASPFLPVRQLWTWFTGTPEVEGAATEISPIPSPSPLFEVLGTEGEVAGATACSVCIWWPLLILQAIGLILHYYITKKKSKKAFWLGGILISIFIYIIFLLINGNCRNGFRLWLYTEVFWCKYFILWVMLVFGIISYLFRPEKEEYLIKPVKLQESKKEEKENPKG